MNIVIRKMECLQDEDGFWVENDGQTVSEFEMPDDSDDETIKNSVIRRLRDWLLNPLDIAAGRYTWQNYGEDLEIIIRRTEEPIFRIIVDNH